MGAHSGPLPWKSLITRAPPRALPACLLCPKNNTLCSTSRLLGGREGGKEGGGQAENREGQGKGRAQGLGPCSEWQLSTLWKQEWICSCPLGALLLPSGSPQFTGGIGPAVGAPGLMEEAALSSQTHTHIHTHNRTCRLECGN